VYGLVYIQTDFPAYFSEALRLNLRCSHRCVCFWEAALAEKCPGKYCPTGTRQYYGKYFTRGFV